MKTIDVDEDVYRHLLSKATEIGETASSIIRRELKLEGDRSATKSPSEAVTHELAKCLGGPAMRFGSRTDRFLLILAEAFRQKPKDFDNVLSIRGRDRVYFARTRDEIVRSGRSTQPLQIPGTPFWVMTNSPTHQKKEMLRQALDLLGYSEAARNAASAAI